MKNKYLKLIMFILLVVLIGLIVSFIISNNSQYKLLPDVCTPSYTNDTNDTNKLLLTVGCINIANQNNQNNQYDGGNINRNWDLNRISVVRKFINDNMRNPHILSVQEISNFYCNQVFPKEDPDYIVPVYDDDDVNTIGTKVPSKCDSRTDPYPEPFPYTCCLGNPVDSNDNYNNNQEHNHIIYNKNIVTMVENSYKLKYYKKQSCNKDYSTQRHYEYAKFKINANTDIQIVFYATHTEQNKNPPTTDYPQTMTDSNTAQQKELLDIIKSNYTNEGMYKDIPFIISGDLNDKVKYFQNNSTVDFINIIANNTVRANPIPIKIPTTPPPRASDYIMSQNTTLLNSYEVNYYIPPQLVTDHVYGIVATFTLNTPLPPICCAPAGQDVYDPTYYKKNTNCPQIIPSGGYSCCDNQAKNCGTGKCICPGTPIPKNPCISGGDVYESKTTGDGGNYTCGQRYEYEISIKNPDPWKTVVCNSPGSDAGTQCTKCYTGTCNDPVPSKCNGLNNGIIDVTGTISQLLLNNTNFRIEENISDGTCSKYEKEKVTFNNNIVINTVNRETGRVVSNKQFKNCLLIIKAILPQAANSFSAIWLLNYNENIYNTEIDMVENKSGDTHNISSNLVAVENKSGDRYSTMYKCTNGKPPIYNDCTTTINVSNKVDNDNTYVLYRNKKIIIIYTNPIISYNNNIVNIKPSGDNNFIQFDTSKLIMGYINNNKCLEDTINGIDLSNVFNKPMNLVINAAVGGVGKQNCSQGNCNCPCSGVTCNSQMKISSIQYIDLPD